MIAAPITYRVGGVQYVAVVAGWGGAFAQIGGDASAAAGVESEGAVVAYALVEETITPDVIEAIMESRDPTIARGADVYHAWCARCHGANAIAGGVNPDLRASVWKLGEAFVPVTQHGLDGTSMPAFSEWLTREQIGEVQRYLLALPRR